MIEQKERAAVLKEADSWCGTQYHHRGRVKRVGADCAMFPYEVYLRSVPHLVWNVIVPKYPPDWHQHCEEEVYKNFVEQFAKPTTAPGPADFVLYKWGLCFAHGGIVVDWPNTIIHVMRNEKVCYAEALRGFLKREHIFYTLWPKPA